MSQWQQIEDIISRYKFDEREAKHCWKFSVLLVVGGEDDATERILPQGRKVV